MHGSSDKRILWGLILGVGCAGLVVVAGVVAVGFWVYSVVQRQQKLALELQGPPDEIADVPRATAAQQQRLWERYTPLIQRLRQVAKTPPEPLAPDFRGELADRWRPRFPELLYVSWSGNAWGPVMYQRASWHSTGRVSNGRLVTRAGETIDVVRIAEADAAGNDLFEIMILADPKQKPRALQEDPPITAKQRMFLKTRYHALIEAATAVARNEAAPNPREFEQELSTRWHSELPELVWVMFGRGDWTFEGEWKRTSYGSGNICRGTVTLKGGVPMQVILIRNEVKRTEDEHWECVIAVRESILDDEDEDDPEPKAKAEKK